MKLILLVALATVAAAASVFRPGEEYIYHYKGHVLNGIPKASKQFAGVLIDTLVVFQFQQDYKVVMKLEKIKLFKINNHISTPPSEPLNENEITLLTGEQAVVLSEHLVKPVKFRYIDGTIQELEKETTDRYWSVNIKKGILSLFQVTLKDKTPTSDSYNSFDSPVTRPRYPYSSGRSSNPSPFWKSSKNSVYTVMETDVTGTCETKYTLISDKTHISPSTSEMYLTAIRDFDSCQNEPFYIQGLFQGVIQPPRGGGYSAANGRNELRHHRRSLSLPDQGGDTSRQILVHGSRSRRRFHVFIHPSNSQAEDVSADQSRRTSDNSTD